MTYDIPGDRTGWGVVTQRIYNLKSDSPPARYKVSLENG